MTSEKSNSELLPCPFCGGPARTFRYNGTAQASCAALHTECAGTDVIAPVAMWNSRALASRHQEPVNEPAELRTYGYSCFGCDKELAIPFRGDADYAEMEKIAGAMGWHIGHLDGQGQYVCADCVGAVWDALPLDGGETPALRAASIPKVEPVGYVRPETLAKLREGDAGPIVGVSAYDTTIPLYAAPQPAPVVTDDTPSVIAADICALETIIEWSDGRSTDEQWAELHGAIQEIVTAALQKQESGDE